MEIAAIIAFIIVTVVAVLFIFLYFRSIMMLVPPENCGASYGTYSVVGGESGSILNTCGDSSNQPCTFFFATLEEAMFNCDANNDRCSVFAFSELTREMSYIDPTAPRINTTLGGIYSRITDVVILA